MKRWAILAVLLLSASTWAVTRSVPVKFNHPDYDSLKVYTYPAGDKSKEVLSGKATIPYGGLLSLNDDTTWVLKWLLFDQFGDTSISTDVIPSAAGSPTSHSVSHPLKSQAPDFDSVLYEVYEGPGYTTVTIIRSGLPSDTSITLNMGHNHRIYERYTSLSYDTVTTMYSIAHMPGDTSGLPVASSPSTCRLWGTIRNSAGEAIKFAKITASLSKGTKNTCDSTLLVERSITERANVSGYFEIDLAWSSCLSDSIYTVTVKGKGVSQEYDIVVPDTTSYKFFELVD